MADARGTGWGVVTGDLGPELERIAGGGLALSTEERLKDLLKWKGFTSFMSPNAVAVGADLRLTPIAQVVGFSGGILRQGILRTTEPGQNRARYGRPRWRERTGPIRSWDTVRRRALERLRRQAQLLEANAVVGLEPQRKTHGSEDDALYVEHLFTGTAVRIDGLRRTRDAPPLLTLASAQELWRLLQAGVEPVGVAGSFASVQTTVSLSSRRLRIGMGRWAPNTELEDLTKSAYEARRLALERLRADALGLDATGLIGIDMEHRERSGRGLPGVEITVHLLATALHKRAEPGLKPNSVLRLRGEDGV
jgi:uncharacterized protein YbjQ (UPF0145 family)